MSDPLNRYMGRRSVPGREGGVGQVRQSIFTKRSHRFAQFKVPGSRFKVLRMTPVLGFGFDAWSYENES